MSSAATGYSGNQLPPMSRLQELMMDHRPPVKPTRELTRAELPIWDMIVKSRARREWVGIDEEIATELCRVLVEAKKVDEMLMDEGYTITGAGRNGGPGGVGINPLLAVSSHLWMRVLRMQMRLAIAPVNSARGAGQANANGRQAEDMAHNIGNTIDADEDDLLPRVGLQSVPVTGSHTLRDREPLHEDAA